MSTVSNFGELRNFLPSDCSPEVNQVIQSISHDATPEDVITNFFKQNSNGECFAEFFQKLVHSDNFTHEPALTSWAKKVYRLVQEDNERKLSLKAAVIMLALASSLQGSLKRKEIEFEEEVPAKWLKTEADLETPSTPDTTVIVRPQQSTVEEAPIFLLPAEIFVQILRYLEKEDVRSIFETCVDFANTCPQYAAQESLVDQILQCYRSDKAPVFEKFSTKEVEKKILTAIEKYASLVKVLDFFEVDITDEDLEYMVEAFSCVDTLILSGCKSITDKGLQFLKKFTKLKSLELNSCKNITDDGLKYLQDLKGLESLKISYCKNITDKGLECFQNMTSLQLLNLNGTNIIGEGLKYVQNLKKLRSLAIVGSAVHDSDLKYLEELPLEKLDVYNCNHLNDAGLQSIGKLTQLQELNLNFLNISDAGIKHLEGLKHLQKLYLNDTKITDEGLKYLVHLPLRVLALEDTSITDAAFQYIGQLKQLEKLLLAYCENVTGGTFTALEGLQNLQKLDLSDDPITDDGLKSIGKLTELKVLKLGTCPITELHYLSGLTRLENLDIHRTHIKDFKALENFVHLKELGLRGVDIDDANLQYLQGLTELQELDLSKCSLISNKGIQVIAQLKKLENLDLSYCGTTEEGLGFVKELPRLQYFRHEKYKTESGDEE